MKVFKRVESIEMGIRIHNECRRKVNRITASYIDPESGFTFQKSWDYDSKIRHKTICDNIPKVIW